MVEISHRGISSIYAVSKHHEIPISEPIYFTGKLKKWWTSNTIRQYALAFPTIDFSEMSPYSLRAIGFQAVIPSIPATRLSPGVIYQEALTELVSTYTRAQSHRRKFDDSWFALIAKRYLPPVSDVTRTLFLGAYEQSARETGELRIARAMEIIGKAYFNNDERELYECFEIYNRDKASSLKWEYIHEAPLDFVPGHDTFRSKYLSTGGVYSPSNRHIVFSLGTLALWNVKSHFVQAQELRDRWEYKTYGPQSSEHERKHQAPMRDLLNFIDVQRNHAWHHEFAHFIQHEMARNRESRAT